MIALLILAAAANQPNVKFRMAEPPRIEFSDPCAGWEWCPIFAKAYGIKNRRETEAKFRAPCEKGWHENRYFECVADRH